MKTNNFKNRLFEFYTEKLVEEFPTLEGKVFRERLRSEQPTYPFVVLKSGERTRIHKRFDKSIENGRAKVVAQFRLPVTFSVYDLNADAMSAEEFTDDVIDFTEYLFTDCESTHLELAQDKIVVNEMMNSGVRDLSSFCNTNQEFRKEIVIVFDFEDVQTYSTELGLDLDVEIEAKE